MRALHGHNSRRPDGYLGFQGRRVEHGFETGQGADGQAMGTGKPCRRFLFVRSLVCITSRTILNLLMSFK